MGTLQDQLNQWKKANGHKEMKTSKKKRRRRSESLTAEDLRELMGVNRQTLRRGRGGAFKR